MKKIFKQEQEYQIKRFDREVKKNRKAVLVWFTGLSGSGKSTLVNELEKFLFSEAIDGYILDGDNIRSGLNSDLSFTDQNWKKNIRRFSEVSNLFIDAELVCIAAFISPFKDNRALSKKTVGEDRFIDVFEKTPIEVCEQRDIKGLNKKARKGEIKNFTGISSSFEVQENPALTIDTSKEKLETSINRLKKVVLDYIILIGCLIQIIYVE